jgi:Fe-S cluster assembly protein SufD
MSSPHTAPDRSGAGTETGLSETVEATAAALVEPGSDPAGAIGPEFAAPAAGGPAAGTAAPAGGPVAAGSGAADARDAADEGAAERAALAGELFAPGVGAQAGPPRTPARATAVPPGASSAGGHSHGPGERPRAERFTSRNPDEFGVPTGREEEWRFTPLARLRDLLEPFPADQALAVETSAPDQVEVREVAGDTEPVGTVLAPADRVSALALERVRTAHVVTVPKGTTVADPVTITLRGQGELAYGHLVVDVQPSADAVVVLDHVGSARLAANVELRVGDGASLTFLSVHDWADDAVHVVAQAAQLGRDARLRHAVVTFGGDLVRVSPTVRFTGPGGEAELLGLSFADAGQHQEARLYVDHAVPHCRSRVTYKGALQGRDAHTVWIGDVRIRPEGVATDTYELNRNLLLTDGARADSVPNLEIETGEVAGAGHASATGRFDDQQLFYLMARGIPEVEARRLVVRGFFADVINAIGVPAVAERLTAAVEAELAAVGA